MSDKVLEQCHGRLSRATLIDERDAELNISLQYLTQKNVKIHNLLYVRCVKGKQMSTVQFVQAMIYVRTYNKYI